MDILIPQHGTNLNKSFAVDHIILQSICFVWHIEPCKWFKISLFTMKVGATTFTVRTTRWHRKWMKTSYVM